MACARSARSVSSVLLVVLQARSHNRRRNEKQGDEMEFDFTTMKASDRYKLLVSLVVPRPIALVTTLGANGVVNAAPFSFFNVLGDDPPIVIVGVDRKLNCAQHRRDQGVRGSHGR
jgi:flavin reductase (DIM6/NTAB) family NADH-FMN oxidoreductase RutF